MYIQTKEKIMSYDEIIERDSLRYDKVVGGNNQDVNLFEYVSRKVENIQHINPRFNFEEWIKHTKCGRDLCFISNTRTEEEVKEILSNYAKTMYKVYPILIGYKNVNPLGTLYITVSKNNVDERLDIIREVLNKLRKHFMYELCTWNERH